MKTEKSANTVMSLVLAFTLYTALEQTIVFADNSVQKDLVNQEDFNGPLPFLQSQYEKHINQTTDELGLNSTEPPDYTTSQKLLISNITTDRNSVSYVTKPGSILYTTKTPEVTSYRNGMETTIHHTGEEVASYQTVTKYIPTTHDPTTLTTTKQAPVTRQQSDHIITSDQSVSQPTRTSTSSGSVENSTVTDMKITTHFKVVQTTQYIQVTDVNATEELYNSTVDPSRLARQFADDFQSRDSFWPIALALTICIPTIVVLAVTITVLYRGRMAKPRSLLAMYGQDYGQM